MFSYLIKNFYSNSFIHTEKKLKKAQLCHIESELKFCLYELQSHIEVFLDELLPDSDKTFQGVIFV